MPNPIRAHDIAAADAATPDLLLAKIKAQPALGREVVGFQLVETDVPNAVLNTIRYRANIDAPDIDAEIVPQDATLNDRLRTILATKIPISYADAAVGPVGGPLQRVVILISRPGRQLTWRGKMSTFGGTDSGMSQREGLALADGHIAKYPGFFENPALGTLGHNLKEDMPYLACRWDYAVTSPSFLRDPNTFALVTNAITGKSEQARPIDWGPHISTGREADLSPGLASRLGLKTNDECTVTLSLRTDQLTSLPTASPAAGAFINSLTQKSQEQFDSFHQFSEGDAPLRAQIRKYWEDLGFAFPGVGTAWSAVFISWCVKQAGASAAEFLFAPRHSAFVQKAIQNAMAKTGVFRAWPIDRYKPQIGDLIHNNREGGAISYSQAANDDSYPSHSVIVVGFKQEGSNRFAITIGGNEGDTVGQKRVRLTAEGFVGQRSSDSYISVVQTLKV